MFVGTLVLSSLLLSLGICYSFRSVTINRLICLQKQSLLMAQKDINMPALSSTMKEGKIVSWTKKIGDKVSSGDVLLVVESDKADMDVESFEDGYLAAIYTPEGGSAAVGAVVATLVESVGEINSIGKAATAAEAAPVTESISPQITSSSGPAPAFEQILMPALSSTMKEGKIVSWSKKVGDKVSSGDMVLVVESDKADMDVESYEEGYLAVIAVKDGETAAVGAPVGYLVADKDQITAVQQFVASGRKGGSSSVSTPVAAVSVTTPIVSTPTPVNPVPVVVNDGRVV